MQRQVAASANCILRIDVQAALAFQREPKSIRSNHLQVANLPTHRIPSPCRDQRTLNEAFLDFIYSSTDNPSSDIVRTVAKINSHLLSSRFFQHF